MDEARFVQQNRVATTPTANPAAAPMSEIAAPCLTTSQMMLFRCAPSARRVPISLVRCRTT